MTPPSEVIGRRIGAALLDILVLVVIFVVVGIAAGDAHAHGSSVNIHLHGAVALVFFAIAFAYYFVLELRFGRTLGKRLLGLRVARADGGAATAGPVLARTILRVVDGLPFLYLVGFIAMLATGPKAARLGDLAAGTSVIRT